jgi:hypothetical protein
MTYSTERCHFGRFGWATRGERSAEPRLVLSRQCHVCVGLSMAVTWCARSFKTLPLGRERAIVLHDLCGSAIRGVLGRFGCPWLLCRAALAY